MSQTSSSVEPSQPQSAETKQLGIRPLRIWPAVVLVAAILALLLFRITPGLMDDASLGVLMLVVMGPILAAAVILLWWLFFSRAPWKEKLVGAAAIAVVGLTTFLLVDKSMHAFPLITAVIPTGLASFAIAIFLTHRMMPFKRTVVAILALIIGFGYWTLVRFDGMWGDANESRSWRWQPTAEDNFLASIENRSRGELTNDNAELPLGTPEWPGFRGPNRDGTLPGARLLTDWRTHPPKQLWTSKVGPGWSSFAVAGRRLFTMEQRGENEAVVCLDGDNGRQLWAYQYPSRFWEAMGGAGPRATPTVANGNLFTLGGNGLLHRLDPVTGEMIWQRDLTTDANRQPPTWGFASSPLVVGDRVIVYAGGEDDKGVIAYDVQTGEPIWSAPSGNHSYSSPHLLTIGDQSYVAMVTNQGLSLLEPTDGHTAFEHQWMSMGYRTLQPMLIQSTSVLIGSGMGEGTRRIDFSGSGDTMTAEEAWTSKEMESDFNDFVAHQGQLYGFDRNIFVCIDLTTGQRRWKKGRYGNGQVLLLPDANQLLVTTEKGEVVLLNATPEKLDELARIKVFEGKTWNHPVVVGNRMYLRNAEEAACLELPIADSTEQDETTATTN